MLIIQLSFVPVREFFLSRVSFVSKQFSEKQFSGFSFRGGGEMEIEVGHEKGTRCRLVNASIWHLVLKCSKVGFLHKFCFHNPTPISLLCLPLCPTDGVTMIFFHTTLYCDRESNSCQFCCTSLRYRLSYCGRGLLCLVHMSVFRLRQYIQYHHHSLKNITRAMWYVAVDSSDSF